MRLKVCHIIPTLVQGGAEKQLSLLATNLDRQRFESHVVVLTHSGPIEEELRQQNIEVHLINKRGKFDPLALRRLTKTLKQLAPHIVHTWLFAANSYGRMAAHRAKVPVIVTGERCVDPWKSWLHHRIDRYLMRYTDRLVTNTSAVSQFYAQHGIAESKFTVIPNAVRADDRRIGREELLQRLGLPPRAHVVGAVGRLWKQKGYPDLIWAGELLHVTMQDVWFVIVGDGPDRAQLQEFRDKSGAKDSVYFAGHRRDAQELLSAFDVLWNGSLYEGQSNTILEAMALGVPVIASDIPGNRDLVVEGETGHLFALGDVATLTRKTKELLSRESARFAMGSNSQRRAAEHFSLAGMVREHEQLYESLWQRRST